MNCLHWSNSACSVGVKANEVVGLTVLRLGTATVCKLLVLMSSKYQPCPEPQQEVILLHWYEGLSFAEIGLVLRASEGAVKVRAHRAYVTLRQMLGPKEIA